MSWGVSSADPGILGRVTEQAAPAALAPRTLLGGRYRLLRSLRSPGSGPDDGRSGRLSALWRAEDEVLARPVAVRILDLEGPAAARVGAFLSAAARAGRATGAGLAHVLDAAEEPAAQGPAVAYVVTEWVEGHPLDLLLQEGRLPTDRAAAIVRAVALALARAHAAGVHAGRLHPGQVVLAPGSGGAARATVRLTDLEVAAALHAVPGAQDPVRQDTEDAARVLYAALTGCWPRRSAGGPGGAGGEESAAADWQGLPAPPRRDGHLLLPGEMRAGIPPEVDTVIARALDPPRRPAEPALRTPTALADALAPLCAGPVLSAQVGAPHGDPGDGQRGADAERGGRADSERDGRVDAERGDGRRGVRFYRRRWVRLGAAALFLALVAAGGWASGLVLGKVPTPPSAVPKIPGQATPGAAAERPLQIKDAFAFDPVGADGENENLIPRAYDEDPTTAWMTERYATAAFGGLKPGVGMLVDLGTPSAVGRVVLTVPPGETLQLYVAGPQASARPTALDGLTSVTPPTDAAGTGDTTLTPSAGTVSRWWVVWLTRLPPAPAPGPGGAFEGSITELVFYPGR